MRWIKRGRLSGDDGVSLVEAVVALFIAAGVFMALAAASITSLKSTLVSRQNQQASDLATQLIESTRAMAYGAMTMATADVPAGDTNISGTAAAGYTANTGSGTPECIALSTGGSLTPHVTTYTRNKKTYTTKTYITYPGVTTGCSTATGFVRRVTVVVTWSLNGKTRTRRLSTLVADTLRGLPLPRFTLAKSTTVSTAVGGGVSLPLRIANLGARDSFEFTVSPSTPSYTFYVDDNKDGVHQDTELTQLSTSVNGKPSTGLLDPGAPLFAVAYRVINAGEVSSSAVVTATSVAQPTYPGATHTVTDVISVAGTSPAPSPSPTSSASASPSASPSPTASPSATPAPVLAATCSGSPCYTRTLWLHNSTAGGATSTQEVMPANLNNPTASTLPAYSGGTTPGRAVVVGKDQAGSNDLTEVADWRFQVPAASKFNGTMRVTFWASADTSSASSTHTLSVLLGTSSTNSNNNNVTSVVTNSVTATNWGTSPRQVIVDLPVANLTVANGQYLVLRVQVAKSSSSAMHLDYDTLTYGAGLSVPVVYGIP